MKENADTTNEKIDKLEEKIDHLTMLNKIAIQENQLLWKRVDLQESYISSFESSKIFKISAFLKNIKRLMKRQEEVDISEQINDIKTFKINHKKPKVALVVDRPNWALHNIAKQVINNLYSQFEFTIINTKLVQHLDEVFILAKDYDIIHFFWRGELLAYKAELIQNRIKQQGYSQESFYDEYIKNKLITTAVYDHLYLCGDDSEKTKSIFGKDTIVDSYYVSSEKLKKIYDESDLSTLKPSCVNADGVDLDLFGPGNLERFESLNDRAVVFGWVGNSKWDVKGVDDLKGIKSIIKPAIKILKDEGYNIKLYTSDEQDEYIPHDKMPDYYASIDCYLCASLYEGTPNPILESIACGVPVITTDVGIVPEVFGEKQQEFILKERSVECMVDAIRKIVSKKAYFQELSCENLSSIKTWDWSIKAENFAFFWNSLL